MNNLDKIILGSVSSLTMTTTLGEMIERSMVKYDTDIREPIDTISIIMASYNEENLIEIATSSVKSQSIIAKYPEYFELILVDSCSKDRTVELAKPFVDKIVTAPRGKLTARNLATKEAKGNIIVSTDSDSYYPYHWLNTLLRPFNDLEHKSIIAANGNTFDYGIPKIPGKVHTVAYFLDRTIIHPRQMVGRNSAYYKHGFYLSGGFNESINQFDINAMLNEEEVNFGDRLKKFGRIIFKNNASCVHFGGRKIGCRWGLYDREYCNGQGFGKDRF